jgi:hypothetical protein
LPESSGLGIVPRFRRSRHGNVSCSMPADAWLRHIFCSSPITEKVPWLAEGVDT